VIRPAKWILSPAGVKTWSNGIPGLKRRLSRPVQDDIRRVKRLGVLRADGMGDLVLTFGFLNELRRKLPETRITLICQKQWAEWMRDCPWIDGLIGVDISPITEFSVARRAKSLADFMRQAWALDFEMVLNPGTLFEYAPSRTLSYFSGAPVRICWEDPSARIDCGGSLNTTVLPFSRALHEAEKCRLMLEALGLDTPAMTTGTWWAAADGNAGRHVATKARNDRRWLVALGVASSERAKRWPATSFLELVRQVRQHHDAAFLAIGGADMTDECRWLSQQDSAIVSCVDHGLSIGASWAAVAQCDLYAGNDTGMMHLAAAAGIPVVAIIGVPEGAPPGTRGDAQSCPVGTIVRIVRPPRRADLDFRIDVSAVPPDDVAAAVFSLMAQGSSPLGP
jgi:ADP-heptose:LPS heptosyltransferase